ncbi:MAG TPA: tetratricopeptide repeat protein [Planctomycetota bacterium]|nr:tetratricopeptide repeat protein [Planctomycetota bacterium]
MKLSPRRAWSAYWIAIATLVCAFQARAEADKVTLVKNKEVISGRITKDDRDGLEIDMRGGAKRTVNSSEIADVEWDVSDENFHDAVGAFRSGAYVRAASSLESLIKDKESLDRVRPLARPYLYYLYAESKYRSGKAADAMAAYQDLITKFPNSRYVPAALSNMCASAIQSRNFDKLPALLKLLADGGPEQKQLADYYEGEAALAQNKPADALRKYANAAVGGVQKVKAMALVGQARAYAATNEPAKSREAAQAALALNPPEGMAALAHTLIGDAIVADADAKKLTGSQLQDALLDAVLEYMRVQTQYPADAQTEGDALLKSGECFMRLAKLPTRSGSDDRERALALFNRIGSERKFATNQDLLNKAAKHLEEMK